MKLLNVFCLALISLFFSMATPAEARPRLFTRTTTTNTTTVRPVQAVSNGISNATAQGVALIQATRGWMGHCGGYNGYEGVGKGPTAQSAISNCCYYGRKNPVDIGVAQGADGYYYACVRYSN